MDRLLYLASLTAGYQTIADVGTDHAYLCIYAVTKYNCYHAYALDINQGPLINAETNIKKNGLEGRIETRLSNGLQMLNEVVDLIVISGMGGSLISEILYRDFEKIKKARRIIIQANSEVHLVRKFIKNTFLQIIDEKLIYDHGHYYQILIVEPSAKKINIDDLDIYYGPILRREKSELFIKMYKRKLKLLQANYEAASPQGKSILEKSINELKEILDNDR